MLSSQASGTAQCGGDLEAFTVPRLCKGKTITTPGVRATCIVQEALPHLESFTKEASQQERSESTCQSPPWTSICSDCFPCVYTCSLPFSLWPLNFPLLGWLHTQGTCSVSYLFVYCLSHFKGEFNSSPVRSGDAREFTKQTRVFRCDNKVRHEEPSSCGWGELLFPATSQPPC